MLNAKAGVIQRTLVDAEDDFAELLSLLQVTVGSDAVIERPDPVDDGAEAAIGDQLQHGAEFVLRTHIRAHDRELAGEEKAEIEFGIITGGAAAGDKTAADGEALDAFIPGGGANMLDDDIHSVLVGQAVNLFGDGHDTVMNDFVGADGFGFFELFVGARRGDDARTEELRDLNGRAPDAAASGEHEDGFAGAKLSAIGEHVPRGEKDQRHRSGMNPIETFGIGHAVHFGTAHEFRATTVNHKSQVGEIAAEIVLSSETSRATATGDAGSEHHLLADVDVANVVANLDDFTGYVAARDVRKRNGIVRKAVANPQIEVIEGTGAHADENFVRMDLGFVHIGVVQHAGIAVLVKDDGFHETPPRTGLGGAQRPADIS